MKQETSTKTNAAKNQTAIRGEYTYVPNTIFSLGLSPKELFVYIALLSYDWHKGECLPSRELLLRDTGISERDLDEVIKKLKEKGLV